MQTLHERNVYAATSLPEVFQIRRNVVTKIDNFYEFFPDKKDSSTLNVLLNRKFTSLLCVKSFESEIFNEGIKT